MLKERFPDNAEQRIWYLERQRKFRELVATPTDGWRPVNHFQDRHHLGIQAAIVQGTLRHELIRASDMRPNGVLRETTEAELGSLGRREHLSLARRALDRAAQLKDVALCLNIAGPEDDGQGEFAQALAAEVLKKRCRAPSARRPPFDRYRLDDMVRWAGKVFGGSETTTLSALAALIVTKTKERPLALIVDPVDAFEGGHAGFHACFWQPLVEGLKANAPVRRPCLIVATVSYRELSDVAAMPIAPAPASPSGELALPSLGTLHEADVIGWLAEMEVPDDSGCRHVDLAAAVTRTPAGAVDGTPRRVLERLRRLDLWPAGEP